MSVVRRISRAMIVADLRRVFSGEITRPTYTLYRELGGIYAGSTIAYVVGSWQAAVALWRSQPSNDSTPVHQRPCLRCDRPFASAGAHNRLCQSCIEWIRNESIEEVHACPVRDATWYGD